MGFKTNDIDGESHVALIDDARRGLEDIMAGRTQDADTAIAALQKRRAMTKKSSVRPARRR